MKHGWFWPHIGAALLTISVLLYIVGRPAHAQRGDNLSITQIDTSRYPDVDVYVSSRDGDHSVIEPPPPITLEELAGAQTKPYTATGELQQRGVSVMVLVDLHRRMRGVGMPDLPDMPPTSRLDTARAAIIKLMDGLLQAGAHNQIGVHGYHRDLIEIMPFQPLLSDEAKNYVDVSSPDNRLFDILPKHARTPTNDPTDPHAKSALSQAVVAAVAELQARSLPGQQQVILIIGSTCDDLRPELTLRNDLNCALTQDMLKQLRDYNANNQLSIVGVGVGSEDPDQPLVTPDNIEDGFNYTANFAQMRQLALALPPERFFVLHTPDPAVAPTVWDAFTNEIVRPIVKQGTQLKASFKSDPQLSDAPERTIRLTIGGAQVISLPFDVPRFTVNLFVNGMQVLDSPSPIPLQPGQHTISASVQLGAAQKIKPAFDVSVPEEQPAPFPWLLWSVIILLFVLFVLVCVLVVRMYIWANKRVKVLQPTPQKQEIVPAERRETEPVDYPLGAEPFRPYLLEYIQSQEPLPPYAIKSALTIIGSAKNRVHLHINDPSVSDQHAKLSLEKDQLFVEALYSHNGTFVNQERLKPGDRRPLKPGDILTVGKTVLALKLTRSDTQILIEQPSQTSAPARATVEV
jgi:hypothetical protein